MQRRAAERGKEGIMDFNDADGQIEYALIPENTAQQRGNHKEQKEL
jgi:hypothetical protein